MNMPGPSVLQTILARTASDGVRSDATCNAATPEARLRFLVDQIDACILPRHLSVSSGSQAVLTLVAVERSLAQIDTIALKHTLPDAAMGQPLRHASPETIEAIATALSGIAADYEHLTCQTSLLSEDTAPVTSGVSVRQLLQALRLDPVASVPMLDRIADLAEGFALGVCSLDEGWELRQEETPQMTQALDLADVILGDEAALTPLLEDAAFLVFDAGNGLSIGVYGEEDGIGALLGPSPDMAGLVSTLFAGPT